MEDTRGAETSGERAMVELWRMVSPTVRTQLLLQAATEAAREVGSATSSDFSQLVAQGVKRELALREGSGAVR